MSEPLFVRSYRPEDRDACHALFDSNIPASFLPQERPMFVEFLEHLPGPYIVIEDAAGRVVACGGMASRESEAALCWAVVEAQRRRRGIGSVLIRMRLAMIARIPGVSRVGAYTSPVLTPFFEREGLQTVKKIDNYVRPAVYMAFELDGPRRAEIEARLSALLAQGHRLADGVLTGA